MLQRARAPRLRRCLRQLADSSVACELALGATRNLSTVRGILTRTDSDSVFGALSGLHRRTSAMPRSDRSSATGRHRRGVNQFNESEGFDDRMAGDEGWAGMEQERSGSRRGSSRRRTASRQASPRGGRAGARTKRRGTTARGRSTTSGSRRGASTRAGRSGGGRGLGRSRSGRGRATGRGRGARSRSRSRSRS